MPEDELPPSLIKNLQTRIRRNDLQAESDAILSLAQPCYLITRGRGSRIKLGASHFGGLPHLTPGTDWPLDGGELMTFVAQINLSDLGADSLGLPDSGWLLFFVGGTEATGSEHAVLYVEADAPLREIHPPEGVAFRNDIYPIGGAIDGVFPPCLIKFSLGASLAPFNMNAHEDDTLIRGYIDLHCDVGSGSSRLRGHPSCNGDVIDTQRYHKHMDWTLLLQIDSFDPIEEMCWWDNGKLSFLIRRSDLKKRRFSKTIAYLAASG
ncbi:MAG: YwqG family protein [Thermoguttaceae bacterium]